MKRYLHLNDVYISERLKSKLSLAKESPVSAFIAPMGYGKTTAINYLVSCIEEENSNAEFIKLYVSEEGTEEFWSSLCQMAKKLNKEIAGKLEETGFPYDNAQKAAIAQILWNERENIKKDVYIIIEELHNLNSAVVSDFFLYISEKMPLNIHIILSSRNRIFDTVSLMEMGRNYIEIGMGDLRLTEEELNEYLSCCSLDIGDENKCGLMEKSQGWISLIYYFLKKYSQSGMWKFDDPEIIRITEKTIFAPLSEDEKKIVLSMCTADSFSFDMASFVLGKEKAEKALKNLTDRNAFVYCDSSGKYIFHKVLLDYGRYKIKTLSPEAKAALYEKAGDWEFSQGENLKAMIYYGEASCWKKLLGVITEDRGSSLSGKHDSMVLSWCKNCPRSILKKHPEAIVILALERFSVQDIGTMLCLNDFLLKIIDEDKEMSEKRKNNLRGESKILLSFLAFNNIEKMGRYYKEASSLMTENSRIVNNLSPWTFGSPSVLALYHRECGKLDEEIDEMMKYLPYYYRLTDFHGSGAEYSMLAESCLLRGNIEDAEINYYLSREGSGDKNQFSVLLTSEFIYIRLLLYKGDFLKAKEKMNEIVDTVKKEKQYALFHTLDICRAWIYSIFGRPELIPEWVFYHSYENGVLSVTSPVFFTVQNQALLAKGEYAKVISASIKQKEIYKNFKMVLCDIYLGIQTAAAYFEMDRKEAALRELSYALDMAGKDGIIIPFAENIQYIEGLLADLKNDPFYKEQINSINSVSNKFNKTKKDILKEFFREKTSLGLSKRELEVAKLASERKTAKEIAEELNLSENTVKNHLKSIYDKLGIAGRERNKKNLLADAIRKI